MLFPSMDRELSCGMEKECSQQPQTMIFQMLALSFNSRVSNVKWKFELSVMLTVH